VLRPEHPSSLLRSTAHQAHLPTKWMLLSECRGKVDSIACQGRVGAFACRTQVVLCLLVGQFGAGVECRTEWPQTRSIWLKKKGISTAAVAAASEPWIALRSIFSP
jgi:hypothetical protein